MLQQSVDNWDCQVDLVSIQNVLSSQWIHNSLSVSCMCTLLVERGVPTRGAFFGQGSGPIHLSRAECKSEDTQLMDCTIDMTGINGCDHSEDAGVICNGMCVYNAHNNNYFT